MTQRQAADSLVRILILWGVVLAGLFTAAAALGIRSAHQRMRYLQEHRPRPQYSLGNTGATATDASTAPIWGPR